MYTLVLYYLLRNYVVTWMRALTYSHTLLRSTISCFYFYILTSVFRYSDVNFVHFLSFCVCYCQTWKNALCWKTVSINNNL